MLGVNATDILQTAQTTDYSSFIYNMATTTYVELLAFTAGVFLYAIFIWIFYRNLAKRNIFKVDFKGIGGTLLFILKYFIVFPFYVVIWFLVFTVFLVALTENVSLIQIAMISTALVSTIRITSYLREELSHDLAKLTPLALLGVFLTDPNFFSLDLVITRLMDIPSLGWKILHFLSFIILLEWILRIFYSIASSGKSKQIKEEPGLKKE